MYSDDKKLAELQKGLCALLGEFDRICRGNHLRYYVCGGTLIGAVREKGFIPWDDDIDVLMPRKDYEWLLSHYQELTSDRYTMYDYRYDGKEKMERIAPTPLFMDRNISVRVNYITKSPKQYGWLDIHIMDGMPSGQIMRMSHFYHTFLLSLMCHAALFDEVINQEREDRSKLGKMIMWLLRHWNPFTRLNARKLYLRKHKIAKKYQWDASDYVWTAFGAQRKKDILRREWFAETIRMPFEDIEVNVPVGYDAELRHYFGDYMTPPTDPEARERHHHITILETGYEA